MHAQAWRVADRRAGDAVSNNRKGKMQIGGHFDPADVYTLQELLARETRERGNKKTMQEALEEMVADYCKKHGVTLPSTAARKPKGKAGESV
jgi:hypothetical protein